MAEHILVIEDDPQIADLLRRGLIYEGYSVKVAGDGPDGLAAARDRPPDLVLLDLSLGDADGFDVLTELRAAYPSLPVVVVSASDRTSDVIRAIDMGAMGFVPKRSSQGELHEALRMVMAGSMYVPPSMLGLDFAPLAEEPYDLVIPADRYATPAIQALLSILNSDAFRHIVAALGGYNLDQSGTETWLD